MRMRKYAPILILALSAGCGGCGYNRIVQEEQQVEAAWSQVENQLQRRADLIPNLVEVVKGYARHEKGVFDDIANARAAMLGASSRADKIQSANQFEGAISKLMMLTENYPQLKADANFRDLSAKLVQVEDALQYARRFYNGAVKQYVTRIESFPDNLMAKAFRFQPMPFFETTERAPVKVTL